MNPTANSDIHEAVVDAISARPYTHRQDVDAGIVAVVTVEADMRFLNATLRSLLTQSVLPGVIVIADATGLTTRSVQTSFEVIHSPAGPAMEVPQAKQVSVQVVRAKGRVHLVMPYPRRSPPPILILPRVRCGCCMMIPVLRITGAWSDCSRRGAMLPEPAS